MNLAKGSATKDVVGPDFALHRKSPIIPEENVFISRLSEPKKRIDN